MNLYNHFRKFGIFAILSISSFVSSEDKDEYERFSKMPLTANCTYNLKSEEKLLASILKNGDPNKYALFTRLNPDKPQFIMRDKWKTISDSNFNPKLETVVLIHGWLSNIRYYFVPKVTTAILKKRNVNVIAIDWEKISSLEYCTALKGVPKVGEYAGRFLEYVKNATNAPYTYMHLVGHSLGAHVAGIAGKHLKGKAARITGLDPAGPGWYDNPNRLSRMDAVYVDVVHTNAYLFGIGLNVGHVDFYPNGGILQPGCSVFACSHVRAYNLFAASLEYPDRFMSRECQNILLVLFDLCSGNKTLPLGGDSLEDLRNSSGMYRVNTGSEYPY